MKPNLYEPGQSGNPAGRPRGTVANFDKHFRAFARDVYERAQAGDEQAQELILRAVLATRASTTQQPHGQQPSVNGRV